MKYVPPLGSIDPDASYVDGNPGLGVEGTKVPAAAIEHGMREIHHAIVAAGLTPDDEDLTQLASAIAALTNPIPTGIVSAYAFTTAPSGWVMVSNKTIGDASSNATNRANADTWLLFKGLWESFTDAECPIYTSAGALSTRGASAAADYALHKAMTTIDVRGRIIAGLDNMGGTAANRMNVTLTGTKASTSNGIITGLSSTSGLCVGMKAFGTGIGAGAVISSIDSASQVTLSVNSSSTGSTTIRFGIVDGATQGATGGSHIHQLTIGQMPNHDHGQAGRWTASGIAIAGDSDSPFYTAGGASQGGDQAHPNLPPVIMLPYIIKL